MASRAAKLADVVVPRFIVKYLARFLYVHRNVESYEPWRHWSCLLAWLR